MRFAKRPSLSITLPSSAGPNQPRIVIGPNIPTELAAYYTVEGATVIGAFLSYDASGNYHYEAALYSNTPPNTIFVGRGFWDVATATIYPYFAADYDAADSMAYMSGNVRTMTFRYGDLVDVIERQTWNTYTPALTATTTNPTIGTNTQIQTGRWHQDMFSGLVTAQFRIQFGTVGPAAGNGTYIIELPTGLDLFSTIGIAPGTISPPATSGRSDILGYGTIIDNSGAVRRAVAFLAQSANGGAGGRGQVEMIDVSATSGFVTNASPWIWAASDSIAGTVIYLGV